MKLLLYCCKNNKKKLIKKDQVVFGKRKIEYIYDRFLLDNEQALNGKIVAECDFECEYLYNAYDVNDDNALHYFDTDTLKEKELIERSCVSNLELEKYFGKSNGYAIHIKNLHIFDKPKKIEDYAISKRIPDDWHMGYYERFESVGTAPQNMQYVYDVNSNNPNEKIVLISIRPEWLCKILNGEKTIEVRKKVLKEMLK